MRMFTRKFIYYFFIFCLIANLHCKKDVQNTLTTNLVKIEFKKTGGSNVLSFDTDADSWKIASTSAGWLSLSSTSGTEKSVKISVSVNTTSLTKRTETLTITAGNALPISITVTQEASDPILTMTADKSSLGFNQLSEILTLKVTSNVTLWNITSDVEWLSFSQTTGSAGVVDVKVTALENKGLLRNATISLTSQNIETILVTVSQKGDLYPSYNTTPIAADAVGMSSTAVELAAKMKLGWNIGNSMEASGSETGWGNPLITKSLIDMVKANGFNAIRIPCAWNQYMENSTTAKLNPIWLNRVKEVIQYCVDNDMYVLLNIHWDGGWLENNCTEAKQEANNAKQKAFWQQIATHLRGFDEHLLFASANEPNVKDATEMAVLKSYHQTFIDAVRATGGKNSSRVLVVQGPATDIDKTNLLMTSMPTDKLANRLMSEIHFYSPWNFCGMTKDETWGNMFYYWGKDKHSTTDTGRNPSWGEEAMVDEEFKKMKTQFVDKGIPVILGEFSPTRRTTLTGDNLIKHNASREYYLNYVCKQAKANGLIPFYWDNGGIGDNSSGIFKRSDNTVFDQKAIDAMVLGMSK